jgi:anti-sigma factor RsiW
VTFDDMLCRDVVEMITDYLEGALSADERERLERHIASCPGCEGYLDHFRTTIELSGRLRVVDVEPQSMDSLVGVFRAWRQGS